MERNKYKVFLDTNVVLDVLSTSGRNSAESSRLIFQAALSGYLEAVITTQSLLDAAYVLGHDKDLDRKRFGRSVLSMMNYLYIDSIHIFDIRDALLKPGCDFEDDIQFAHAVAEGCDAIITSDRAFLKRNNESGIHLFTPDEFVTLLREGGNKK